MTKGRASLEPVPIGEAIIAESVVIALEQWLERAKRGEIIAIGIAGVTPNRETLTSVAVDQCNAPLIGAVVRLMRRIE